MMAAVFTNSNQWRLLIVVNIQSLDIGCQFPADSQKHEDPKMVERIAGIEPATKAWEAFVLPLNYIRQ